MEKITRIGMDTSKSFFQLHGVDAAERVALKKKLRRSKVLAFFAALEPTKISMEACGAAHHWGRELTKLGHEVVLLPPQRVKLYVTRNKNDAADAAALCEAMTRPDMTFVPIKTSEQQAALMLEGVREQLVNRRTQLANAIRGYAQEFGHAIAKGLDKIEPLLISLEEDKTLPALAREMLSELADEFARVDKRVVALGKKLIAWHRTNAQSRRLAAIPGVGPIGACLFVMKTPDPRAFKSARHFAGWLGLTPKDHSTAGKQRLGRITRAGDERLRSVLVSGATAIVKLAKNKPERVSPWLKALVKRKPPKLAAVALANQIARIAWKMMVTGEAYDAGRGQRLAKACTAA